MTTQVDCKTKESSQCHDLSAFKKFMLSIIGVQSAISIVVLTMTANVWAEQSTMGERLIEFSTRQQSLVTKVDGANEKATTALAVSSKAESNIAWIREGLTELKIAVREINKRNP